MAAMASQFVFFIFFIWCVLLSCSSSGADPLIPAVVTVPATTTTPVPVQNPNVAAPITNPVTTPPAGTNPPPSPVFFTPPGGGSWCVARSDASNSSLQNALDYACGQVDCIEIQPNGKCFNPNSLQSHASYAFNAYYQKNPSPQSCDFSGTAMITNIDPGSGNCVYQATSGSTSSPSPVPQMPPPPTTSSVPVPVPVPVPIPTPPTTVPNPILAPTTTTSSPLPGGVPGTATFPPVFPNMTNPTTTPIITPTGQIPGISPSSVSSSALLQPVFRPIFLLVSSICFGTLVLKI